MGSNQSKNKINYEDIQHAALKISVYKNNEYENKYIIINTMDKNWQSCLIKNTIPIQEEEEMINGILNNKYPNANNIIVIVYGMNSNDESVYTKYDQLLKLGIKNVFIYTGGMFEWLLLNEVYGSTEFPVKVQTDQTKIYDIWKYR